jgi:hypothetical protein
MDSDNFVKIKQIHPILTIKGFIVYCAGTLTSAQKAKFDWVNAIIDGTIISGLTFFSTLGGGSVAGLDGPSAFKAAAVAACAQFFVFLALKRGIVETKEVSA